MKTVAAMAAKKLGNFLVKDFRELFGTGNDDAAERLGALARSTIECLGRSDALYHNLEHTVLVTMAGRDILRGRTMCERIAPMDYSHLIIACLLHDIGYVRGVLKNDTETDFVIDRSGKKIRLPRGASDASLTPIMSIARSCSWKSVWAPRRPSTRAGSPRRSNSPAFPCPPRKSAPSTTGSLGLCKPPI